MFPKIIDKINACKNCSQDLNHFGVKLHQPIINYVVEDVINTFETIVNECFKNFKKKCKLYLMFLKPRPKWKFIYKVLFTRTLLIGKNTFNI
jgi:beta-glucosidase/6-phospho-beta-glucosidase/beta-galactosidase